MINDFTGADRVFIACGYTDLRKGIDGLSAMVQQEFDLDLFTNTLCLFCGCRRDRIKGLYWEQDGFILLYKGLERGIYQWPTLIVYLDDGRIELSNNRADRGMKPFVISQKNFLFANTLNGAKNSAVMFGMIETAKENGLDPYRYLSRVLNEAPKRAKNDPGLAKSLSPQNAPTKCRADYNC